MQLNEEAVKELSPNVTPYRKGNEPKRAQAQQLLGQGHYEY